MGQRTKQTFLQRRHTDGKQTHEKMLNITHCQRSANQNHNEVPSHAGQNGSIKKSAAKSLQSCPTLYDLIDGSPPGSPVPGILQARTLEWLFAAQQANKSGDELFRQRIMNLIGKLADQEDDRLVSQKTIFPQS